jgi:hypothetical protein
MARPQSGIRYLSNARIMYKGEPTGAAAASRDSVFCNPYTLLTAVHESGPGTTRKSLALRRFLPESEGQLTCPGRGREDRS